MPDASKRRCLSTLGTRGTIAALFTLTCLSGAHAASVAVTVSGIVPNGTSVLVALCTNGLDQSNCGQGERLVAQAGTVRTVFTNVAPGRYAVAAYQDLNGSGSIERTRLGLPLEPYGLSNGAGQSRRPSFEAAAFDVREGMTNISVSLRRISQPDKE